MVTLQVFAASALKGLLEVVGDEFVKNSNAADVKFAFTYGGAGQLAKQISTADVDLFISGAAEPVKELQKRDLLVEPEANFATTNIVLISSDQSIRSFKDLLGDSVTQIAIGDPASVSVGKYSEEVLQSLGIFEQLKPKLHYVKESASQVTFTPSVCYSVK